MRIGEETLARIAVRDQFEETRMADAAVVGPLAETHLADEVRRAKVRSAGRRGFAGQGLTKGRMIARTRLEQTMDFTQFRVVEARADPGNEPQVARRLVLPDQQRAEMGPRSRRIGPSANHEAGCDGAFDLDPLARAHAAIRCGAALRDDSFEPRRGGRR